VFALVYLIGTAVRDDDFNPHVFFAALAGMWALAIGALLFQAVGIWRSARRHERERPGNRTARLLRYAAQAMVLAGAAGLLVPFAQAGLPQLNEAWRIAFLNDPGIPDYSLRLMRGNTEAEIAGGIKFGLTRDAARIFAIAPDLKVVHLNSGGGRLGEARKLAQLIRQRGLMTYTATACNSACAIAFLAGRERWLKQGAQIGFHRESFAGTETFDVMRGLLMESGLPAAFADRAVATPAESMWYPEPAELQRVRAISGVVDNYRFAASGYGAHPDSHTIEEQLARTPLFSAIEASEPQTFRVIADSFYQSYMQGMPEGHILDNLRSTRITPLILARMVNADDQLLADYAALMADQYEALGRRSPEACFQYAGRGVSSNLINLLPEPLKLREMSLSEAVLRAPPRQEPPADIPVQTVYRTIFDKLTSQYGPIQVRLLADPAKVPPSQYSAYCTLAVAMFRTVSALPAEQAGVVMSHIFGNLRTAK
jgi:hypothetical protein